MLATFNSHFNTIFYTFLEALRPKVPSHKCLEDCDKEVKKIEDEMVKLITGKAPDIAHMLKNNSDARQSPQTGLGAISEENEETQTEDDLEQTEEDDEDDLEDDEDEDSSKRKNFDDEMDDLDDLSDSNVGGILDEEAAVKVEAPKLVKCEEDDDFVNMFDKMMNDTLKESKVSRSQQMDVVAPTQLRQNKKSYGKLKS